MQLNIEPKTEKGKKWHSYTLFAFSIDYTYRQYNMIHNTTM